MGKSGKKNQQSEKPEKTQSKKIKEESEEIDDQDIEQDEEEVNYFDQEISDRDQELLERIQEEIIAVDEPLKFTWAAIYNLKEQERELNQKMQEQMRAIQEKYEKLRSPIWQKINKVVSGQAAQKQLYTSHQLTKNLNINKNKPTAIPNFWSIVFHSVGFLRTELQLNLSQNIKNIYCNIQRSGQIENFVEQLTISIYFNDNQFIENKELKITILRKANQQIIVKELTPIKFKKSEYSGQQSVFGLIFNKSSTPSIVYDSCQELQRLYSNSIFYYFNEPHELQEDDDSEDEQDGQEQQGESQSESEQQQIKPVKRKGGKANQENKGIQKPDCKQQ